MSIEGKELVKEFRVLNVRHPKWWDLLLQNYKTVRAVDDVSIKVKRGEHFGLLGPNGAGKTTLIKMLCGLLKPTSGTALINRKKPEEELKNIGVMLGSSMIYFRITGYSNLKYFARLYGVKDIDKRIKEVAALVDLPEDWLYSYVEYYSLGMKTKLALARALLHDPQILFLDEPTQGLDPWVSKQVREMIREMNKTVILSSHSLLDLEEVCKKIAIMKNGKIERIDLAKNVKDYFPRSGLNDKAV